MEGLAATVECVLQARASFTTRSSSGKAVHSVTRGSIGRNNHNLETSLPLNGRQDW